MKKLSTLIFFAIILASIPAYSQVRQTPDSTVKIIAIDKGYIRNSSRERVASMGSSGYSRDRWAKVEVKFSTTADFTEQIEFRYYLLMRDRKSMLTGSQTCMYVKKGKWRYTCIYVYPNVLEKYDGGIAGIAVKAYVGGKLMSLYVVGEKRKNWWNTFQGISDTMVNWQMTPFDRSGVERYESLKVQ